VVTSPRVLPDQLPAEEAHDVRALEVGHRIAEERRIAGIETLGVLEHHVGRPLALPRRPVEAVAELLHQRRQHGVGSDCELVEDVGPRQAEHVVHQFLGPSRAGDPLEAVVSAAIAQPVLVEPPPEPFAAVHADAHLEGEPGLDADVHEAKAPVEEVVVVVQALARLALELLRRLARPRAMDLPRPTRFDRRKHADGALADRPIGQEVPRDHLLRDGGRLDELDLLVQLGTRVIGGGPQHVGDRLGEGLEVLHEHVLMIQEVLHAGGMAERQQRAPEHDPVESRDDPGDLVEQASYETAHGVGLRFGGCFDNAIRAWGRRHFQGGTPSARRARCSHSPS
jgi:hypothetical protein